MYQLHWITLHYNMEFEILHKFGGQGKNPELILLKFAE